MSRIRFLLVVALAFFTAGTAFAANIVKLRLDDTIQPISDEYIGRAIEQARQTNADAVLIELQHPGWTGGFHALDHREDAGVSRSGDRLRCSHLGHARRRRASSSWKRLTLRRWLREPIPERRIP